jgi:hypothetical protein
LTIPAFEWRLTNGSSRSWWKVGCEFKVYIYPNVNSYSPLHIPIHNHKMKQPTGTEKPDTPFAPYPTKGVEGYPTFLPAQPQAIGSLLPSDKFPQNAKPAKLFEPLTIRGVTFPNRVWVSPMCMCKPLTSFTGVRADVVRFFR